jgi:hypothetical protein
MWQGCHGLMQAAAQVRGVVTFVWVWEVCGCNSCWLDSEGGVQGTTVADAGCGTGVFE